MPVSNMLNLTSLLRPMYKDYGVFVSDNKVTFKIPLPNITKKNFSVNVYVIAKDKQFVKGIKPMIYTLHNTSNDRPFWGYTPQGLWESDPITDFETNQEYIYRYQIEGPSKTNPDQKVKSMFFGDPFCRMTTIGDFSVFKVTEDSKFPWTDSSYKVHNYEDSIIYELNVAEFNNDFQGVIQRIPYLKSLGINTIELMPITSIMETSNWGYMPIFYFAPEERFGSPEDLKQLVNECHKENIAVILDQVYAHTDSMFPYQVGYDRFYHFWYEPKNDQGDTSPSPIKSEYSNFGRKNDFRRPFTKEFFKTINEFWLNEFHIDGFRYDHVNGYLDRQPNASDKDRVDWYSQENRPTFEGLRDLCNYTFDFSKDINRFQVYDNNKNLLQNQSNIIQIVEDLNESPYQLSDISGNKVNGCWEKGLLDISNQMAKDDKLYQSFCDKIILNEQGNRWQNFNGTKNIDGDKITARPIQYIESHDDDRLMDIIHSKKVPNNFDDPQSAYEFEFGLQYYEWWKLQPFAISLMTSVGVPMLWSGQEFAENYSMRLEGMQKVRGMKPIHWSYFYVNESTDSNDSVLPLVNLYRNLTTIRNEYIALRGTKDCTKKIYEYLDNKTFAIKRWNNEGQIIVIAVNFSNFDQWINIGEGPYGQWEDLLAKENNTSSNFNITESNNGINIPSNYGRILLFKG